MNEFRLGKWICQAYSVGSIKKPAKFHLLYQAVLFDRKADADAFLELSKEMYPNVPFVSDTIDRQPCVQAQIKLT